MKAILTTLIALTSFFGCFAQQELMITQYMHNGLFLNPAYAGVHGGISASALAREQWVGVEGAPNTQLFTIHSPISFYNFSLGATLFRDQIGISSQFGGYFSYAYRIQVAPNVKLSMGLQANLHNYSVNYGEGMNDLFDPGDTQVSGNLNTFKVNFGTGLLLHSDKFYVGLSVPRVLAQKVEFDDPDNSFAKQVRHFYGSAGLVIPVSEKLYLKPNILVKGVQSSPVQVDLNLNALFSNVVWLGVSYRSFESIDGLLGIQINPRFLVSYAHDFTVNQMGATSHEIMVSYIIEKVNKRILTPRYF